MKRVFFSIMFLLVVSGLKAQSDATISKIDSGKIFVSIDKNPEFPGGLEKFYNFLDHTIIYPKIASQNNIQGRVIIKFTVEKDGSLSDLQVVRGITKEIDEEAVRVLGLSPKWNPAMSGGTAVRCSYIVPIAFSLSK
jgi:periplasmic protein TonB